MSNGCAILLRCASSWKLIYHFDFSLLFDMNFIHVLASYIHVYSYDLFSNMKSRE